MGNGRWTRLVAGLPMAACLLLAAAPPPRAPALAENFPDPFVLADGGGYWAYATNTRRDGRRVHVQLARSADGRGWALAGDAMPVLPAWVKRDRPDIWAPEVVRLGGRYLLYFTGRHGSVRRSDGPTLCIGAAIGDSPAGPFAPAPAPLLCDGFADGVIDATLFRDGGRLWMIAKTDGNCCGVPTRFVSVPLSGDGLRLAGTPTEIGGLVNDRDWEGKVIEAPTMVRHDGRLYLFFSGNGYGGADYAMGYARCETPAGPCVKAEENPILSSASAALGPLHGPGHQALFESGGRTMIAYHGWLNPSGSRQRKRALYIDELRWVDGRPVVVRAAEPPPHQKRNLTPAE